jgi:hypothetical protein
VDTVALPPGASLKNGMDDIAPPIPPVNPRRRIFTFGRSGDSTPAISPAPMSSSPPRDTTSVFEDDDVDRNGRSRSRTRLTKKLSSGGGLSESIRRDRELEQALVGGPGPQVLHQPVGSPPIVMQGGMF